MESIIKVDGITSEILRQALLLVQYAERSCHMILLVSSITSEGTSSM